MLGTLGMEHSWDPSVDPILNDFMVNGTKTDASICLLLGGVMEQII